MFRRNSGRKPRSLIDRPTICQAMIPKHQEKAVISFNPDGWYDENTDIREIINYVFQYYKQQAEKIPQIRAEICTFQEKLNQPKLKPVDRNTYLGEIRKRQEQIDEYSTTNRINEFREKVRPFLDEWIELNNQEGPYLRLGARKHFSPDKLTLVRNVVSIASDYSPLNLVLKPPEEKGCCPHCRTPFTDENGQIVCENCEIYQDYLIHDADYGDKDHVNNGNKNDYASRETFDKAVINYQGKQQINFPQKLFTDFDEHCRFNGINTYYLTQETVRPIFKSIKGSDYYDHINLFLHEHLRKPLHDLSPHLDLINSDYDIFSQKYEQIKEDDRSSSLPAQYILYILLVRRGIPCEKENFRLADTVEIRKDNDRMAEKVFLSLKWIWQDTI